MRTLLNQLSCAFRIDCFRQDDDRYAGSMFSQSRERVPIMRVDEVDVQQHDVGFLRGQRRQRRIETADVRHLERCGRTEERPSKYFDVVRKIRDEQDPNGIVHGDATLP